jgi:hypothetical protein
VFGFSDCLEIDAGLLFRGDVVDEEGGPTAGQSSRRRWITSSEVAQVPQWSFCGRFPGVRVNGARNFSNYGEVKFPSLAGEVISRGVDRELRFWAAGRDV